MVVSSLLSVINNKPARRNIKVTFRPINEQGMQKMQKWIESEDWSDVTCETSAHRKMEILQNLLVSKYYEYFPKKLETFQVMMNPILLKNLPR